MDTNNGDDDEVLRDWKVAVVKWATDRPLTDVLLVLILTAVLWGAHEVISTTLPNHLKENSDRIERLEERHEAERLRTIEAYDKWIERFFSGDKKAADLSPSEYAELVKREKVK